jgi:hypothetical protein
MPVDAAVADPVRVTHQLQEFSRECVEMAARLRASVDVLGEVFATDLSTMSLGGLLQLCRAILRLEDAPAPNPSWADPAEAYAASILLHALGDDLREMSSLRRQLYEEFSEDLWSLACARRPPAVDRWWQSGRRHRVRAKLGRVTRTGRPPSDVKRVMTTLRRSNELEDSIDEVSTTISQRLGHFVDAGIPDIVGAAEALAALQDLADALGERLDPAILQDLAAADVFVCRELTEPANDVVLSVSVWNANATRAKAVDPLAYSAPQLEQWATEVKEALDVLSYLKGATARLQTGSRTVGQIFEDAITRDRVHDLCGDIRL